MSRSKPDGTRAEDRNPRAAGERGGKLFLVPTPLDHGCDAQTPLDQVLPQETMRTAARLEHWISENAKSTRAFLKRVDAIVPLAMPLQSIAIGQLPHVVHKHGDHDPGAASAETRALLAPALQGQDIGLTSEAGMPAVADPGTSVVRAAHDLGIEVVPLAGPVSILLALAASGLNGQNVAFVGYLPQDDPARGERIRTLEALARRSGQTQLFIETPYRNAALLRALLDTLHGDTRLALASGLTLPDQRIRSARVRDWRQDRPALACWLENRLPTVFAIGA